MTITSPVQKPLPLRRGLPLAGNLVEFRRDPTGFLTNLARTSGDVAAFRLGRQLAVQVNHPDLIRELLVTRARSFSKTRGLDRARQVIGNGLLTSEGELHRRQRRVIQPIFHPNMVGRFADCFIHGTERVSARWKDGEQICLFAEMLRLTLSIVGDSLFGSSFEQEAQAVREAMSLTFDRFDRLLVPWSRLADTIRLRSRRKYEQAQELLDSIVYRTIKECKQRESDGDNLLARLLVARDLDPSEEMDDRQVRDEIMTMFLAGHETTATALTWTFYALSQNPSVEARLHEELDSTLGGRPPTADDVSSLRYTRMVLSEAMRLYPPVWTLTRRAIEDVELGNHRIPRGTVVGASQFVMHRDPRFFEDAEQFDPLRWLPEAVAQRPKYSYFPFGGGPRLCIGEAFAWLEMTLVLATICQNWQVRLEGGHRVELQPFITLRPKHGMPMILHRRRV